MAVGGSGTGNRFRKRVPCAPEPSISRARRFLLHLHVVPGTSGELEEFREFRDRLRGDPSLIASYVAAKQAILDNGTHDSVDYAKAKGAFIAALGYKGADGA